MFNIDEQIYVFTCVDHPFAHENDDRDLCSVCKKPLGVTPYYPISKLKTFVTTGGDIVKGYTV